MREEIEQVHVEVERLRELLQEKAARWMPQAVLNIVQIRPEIPRPSSVLMSAANCRCVRFAFRRASAITSPKTLIVFLLRWSGRARS